MLPKLHFLLGLIISIILYFLFPQITIFQISIIFLSSFLIDTDHYIYYVIKKRDLSLPHAYDYLLNLKNRLKTNQKIRDYKLPIIFLHGIEFIILLIILTFIHKIFLFVLIGVAIHMIFDLSELIYTKFPLYFKISQVYLYIINKNKKELNETKNRT